ncbi:MAG: thioesterase [Porticoccaceae bacterium]|nr:thioesterase [Porticoccaceae bacterium]
MYTETRFFPRFSDTDAAGHINNTAVTQWLEAGRMDLIRRQLPEPAPMVIKRIEVDYDREMTHTVEAVVRTGVERIGNKSLTLRQEIWQDGSRRARALVVECCVDFATMTAMPIPDHLLPIYQRCLFEDG